MPHVLCLWKVLCLSLCTRFDAFWCDFTLLRQLALQLAHSISIQNRNTENRSRHREWLCKRTMQKTYYMLTCCMRVIACSYWWCEPCEPWPMWSYAIFRYFDCSAKHDHLLPFFRMMDHAYTLSCLGGELLIAKQTSKAGERQKVTEQREPKSKYDGNKWNGDASEMTWSWRKIRSLRCDGLSLILCLWFRISQRNERLWRFRLSSVSRKL